MHAIQAVALNAAQYGDQSAVSSWCFETITISYGQSPASRSVGRRGSAAGPCSHRRLRTKTDGPAPSRDRVAGGKTHSAKVMDSCPGKPPLLPWFPCAVSGLQALTFLRTPAPATQAAHPEEST